MANETQEKKLCEKVVNEYDIHNESMVDHLLKQSKRRPWWKRFCSNVSIYYNVYVRDRWYNFKYYIKNCFLFNKILHEWRPWDYDYQVKLFAFGLEQLTDNLEKYGDEVEESRNKKINALRELVALLRTNYEDAVEDKFFKENDCKKSYHVTEYEDGSVGFENIEPEEKQTAEKNKYEKYYEALEQAKNKHYNRIFRLIRGQKQSEIDKLYNAEMEKLSDKEKEDWNVKMQIRDRISDGTGIEGWWD